MPQLSLVFIVAAGVAAALSWAVPPRASAAYQAAVGSALLLWLDPISLPVLLLLTAALHFTTRQRIRFRGASIDAVVLGLTIVFCAVRAGQRAQEWFDLTSIAAPLGFGYYILRLVHYRAEATRGNLRPHGLVQLYAYLAFFPTLIIGPIHRADTFFRWHARRKFAAADLSVAFQRLLYGYVKVVVLARWLVVQQALYVDTLPFPALEVLFASLQYGLFLYFSFAGYSDIAIGLARAMGYRIEENFDSPFLRRNLAEFWRAWHMSLSDWCRRYVFLPVFARTRNHVIALYATMLTLGLWHEFTVRYVLWGAWHAGGLALYRWFDAHIVPRLPVVDSRVGRTVVHGLAIATTFTFVVVGFTITRTENPAAAADAFWVIFTGWSVAE